MRSSIELWRQLAFRYKDLRLVDGIRTQNADALIFISGLNWGYDLSGFPIPGLQGASIPHTFTEIKGPTGDNAFGDLSRDVAVFAAEWGGGDMDLEWGRTLAVYLAERKFSKSAGELNH